MAVLILDTETNISVLQSHIQSADVDWQCHFANNEEQALEILRANSIEVLVLDVVPRDFNRVEFLLQVSEHFPQISRIVYTDPLEQDEALRTVNSIHQYIPRSNDPGALMDGIRRNLAVQNSAQSESLRKLVCGIKSLPSVPSIYGELVDELNSENSTAESISEIVSRDPAITAKILQIVNSALFGLRNRVSDISQAVSLLGTSTIRSLTLSIGAFQSFKGKSDHEHLFVGMMQHSLEVAIFSQTITRLEIKDPNRSAEAFTAGIVHDIGKLVFLSEDPERFQQATILSYEKGVDLIEAETEIWGADHAEVGSFLLTTWGLPKSLTEIVRLHHRPELSNETTFGPLAAVAVADAISHSDQVDPNQSSLTGYLESIHCVDKLETWTSNCLNLVSS